MINKEEAIKLVLNWYEKAPIEKIEEIEREIEIKFPYKELKEGLGNYFEDEE